MEYKGCMPDGCLTLAERKLWELKRDMRVVADHYGCTPEECREMWACAIEHLEDAMVCFESLAYQLYDPICAKDMVLKKREEEK